MEFEKSDRPVSKILTEKLSLLQSAISAFRKTSRIPCQHVVKTGNGTTVFPSVFSPFRLPYRAISEMAFPQVPSSHHMMSRFSDAKRACDSRRPLVDSPPCCFHAVRPPRLSSQAVQTIPSNLLPLFRMEKILESFSQNRQQQRAGGICYFRISDFQGANYSQHSVNSC